MHHASLGGLSWNETIGLIQYPKEQRMLIFLLSSFMVCYKIFNKSKRRMALVEQDLFTIPKHQH
jgi:hypothetical protein